MKQITLGTFASRDDAERAIQYLHQEVNIPSEEISYVYRNTEGDVTELSGEEIAHSTPREGAKKGAVVGGAVGALAGIAAVVGAIPVIGPIFAAGPIAAALGLGGAVGTTAAGALTGAAAGGLIGALVNLGVREDEAKEYEDRVKSGDVLVVVHADNSLDVAAILIKNNALSVHSYEPVI